MEEIATRNERVVLTLEDNFTSGMARAAAAAAALHKSLDGLSGTSVRSRGVDRAAADIDKVSVAAGRGEKDIDRFSGRLGLLRDVALTIGPAFVPIGALAIPAITGLASQMGAAALAGGSMIAAFQGVGGALEAVNKAALEPTAQNLEAARIAMQNLGPEAQSLVRTIQDFRPALLELRNAAAAGLFPGMERAIDDFSTALPAVESLLYRIGDAAGGVTEEFAEGIAGTRGQEFLNFLTAEMPQAITTLGRTVGNLAAGLGELWMAFTPVNNDFSGWLLKASRDFDSWAQGLSQTEGFESFVNYLRENGPRVADAMAAIGNAMLQVVEAAAPMAGPTLAALEAVANVIAAIADSGAGPAIVAAAGALALLSRSLKTIEAVKGSTLFNALGSGAADATGKMTGLQRAVSGVAAGLAGLAVVDALQGGLKDYSIAAGTMTQSILDMNDAAAGTALPDNLQGLGDAIDRLANPGKAEALQDTISNALGGIGNEEEYDKAVAQIESIEAALVGLVQSGNAAEAKEWLSGLNLSDSAMADFLSLMPQYRDALAGVENETRLAGEAGTKSGREIAAGFNQAKSAAQEFRDAVIAANEALTGRSSMRDYEQALDDAKAPKKDFVLPSGEFNIDLKGGREAEAQIDAIASSALAAAENLRGMDRKNFLQDARADLIATAREFGMTKGQAQALADELGLVDRKHAKPKVTLLPGTTPAETASIMRALEEVDNKHAKPQVSLDYSDVQAGINAVTSLLNSISGRSVETTVTTHYQTTGSPGGPFATRHGVATGGYITGPGTGTSDDIPAWLSNGEFVLRAAAVQRYGVDFLHQLNAMRFAQGGLVSSQVQRQPSRASSVSVSAPAVSVGGPAVQVFIDGREVRAVVRSEIDSTDRFKRTLEGGR